jgi:predicted RNase H-like HicB family nuclease
VDITIELERESDGRWVAEVLEIPGIVVHGATKAEAATRARALADEATAPLGNGASAPAAQSREEGLAAIAELRRSHEKLLAARGGRPFPPGQPLLDEARRERDRQLS